MEQSVMKFEAKCKNTECPYEGSMRLYVGFFPQERITRAHADDPAIPRYGFHLGAECPTCRRWQKFLPQTDQMLAIKFYLP